jgi:hypothetical protein
MNLQGFVDKYKGQPVDFDGSFGAQCVDLARQYFKEVWGFTRQPEGVIGAADFYFKHENRRAQRELCDCHMFSIADGHVPPVGAVVIFGSTGTNQYGHIGICVNADTEGMDVFEQDGIANEKALKEGRPQKGAYIGRWNYDRLLGWLTKKGEV